MGGRFNGLSLPRKRTQRGLGHLQSQFVCLQFDQSLEKVVDFQLGVVGDGAIVSLLLRPLTVVTAVESHFP